VQLGCHQWGTTHATLIIMHSVQLHAAGVYVLLHSCRLESLLGRWCRCACTQQIDIGTQMSMGDLLGKRGGASSTLHVSWTSQPHSWLHLTIHLKVSMCTCLQYAG
jgi:hypothetical protein